MLFCNTLRLQKQILFKNNNELSNVKDKLSPLLVISVTFHSKRIKFGSRDWHTNNTEFPS